MEITRLQELIKKVLAIYLKFAAVHTVYRVLKLVYVFLRARYLWRNFPGDSSDVLAVKLGSNYHRLHDYVYDTVKDYPNSSIVRSSEGPEVVLLCNSPEAVEWLLKEKFDVFTKGDPKKDLVYKLLGDFIGPQGIFTLRHGQLTHPNSHEMWVKQRKTGSKIFTKRNFEDFMHEVFVEKGLKVLKILDENKEKYVDMQDVFFKFTMDTIEKLFFGRTVNSVEGEMSTFGKHFDAAHHHALAIIFDNIPFAILGLIAPFPFGGRLFDFSRSLTKRQKEFNYNVNQLDEHVVEVIREARRDPNLKNRRDMISNILNADIMFKGAKISDEVLRDMVLSFIIAGRDTTACTLSWMFYELCKNPESQERLCTEIDKQSQVWEESDGVKIPKNEDLTAEKLPVLNAVLYETMRLHPAVPTNFKMASEDTVYLDGTKVPKGSKVYYNPYSLNRNPKRYKDPEKFDIDRWIPFKEPTLYEFAVFQAGPRYCLGKDMAKLEMKVLVCMLLQKFRFSMKPGESIFYTINFTMSLANNRERNSFNLWVKSSERL
eukprot:maker-scaffold_11-snap-gene-6.4-mRNA-1 protein AED:0.32 eAED:0.32 QI:139/1/1/1/1/1/2/42/542